MTNLSAPASASVRASLFRRLLPIQTRASLLALWFGATSTPLLAAPSPFATGTISGRVASAGGDYLENVQITVNGLNRQTVTDAAGAFLLAEVPAGRVVLRAFYTGHEPREIAVDLGAGEIRGLRVDLSPIGSGTAVARLDPFTITAARETSVAALAVNEQRFAANIKNVVAADAFGDVSQGNVGEFIKYLPSITADFADPNIISVSVRGLPSSLTQVTADGMQVASAHTGGSTRVFQFDQVSINNLSRVELTKVPTPADPADSLGGIVNLVGKSAFERRDAQFNYRAYLNGRHRHLGLRRQPDTVDGTRHRVLPNADFSYTVPLNENLGFVLSGITANSFDERRVAARVYNTSLAGTGASPARPFMQTFILQNAPRFIYRDSLSLKADWRVSRHGVLSASVEHSGFRQNFGMNQFTASVGANAAPVAPGTALSFGPDFTRGATGRGTLTLDGQYFDIRGATDLGSVRYRFDNGAWQIRAAASASRSTTRFDDVDNGHFYTLTTQLGTGAAFVGSAFTVNLLDITHEGPRNLDIRDNQGRRVDVTDPRYYQLASASSLPRDVVSGVRNLQFSARRRLHRFPFPFSLEAGAAERRQENDTRLGNSVWTYNGPDGNAATADPASPFLANFPPGVRDHGFGVFNIPWASPAKAHAAWQRQPGLFTQTLAQQVAAETFRLSRSEKVSETVTAGYLQSEARVFRGRTRILAGVRFERTAVKGEGPLSIPTAVFQRDANGNFVRDSRGALVRRPEAGAVGSLEQLRLTLLERGARAGADYSGFYPGLHVTHQFAADVQVRFAYARTYGRPNFTQIIPNTTINDFEGPDPTGALGTINVRNPGLRPWQAENLELSVEHYTAAGGLLTAGVYRKELDGFFAQRIKLATTEDLVALDLDPRYAGYQVTSTYNLGKGRVSGFELNARQPLSVLGNWGRRFEVFANGSFFKDTNSINGRTLNAGVVARIRPVTFDTKVNYRSESRRAAVAALGPDAYEFEGARTTVDATLTVALARRASLFLSASNLLNDKPSADRRGSATPEYAQRFREQEYGALYSLGVRGTF